MPHPDDRRWTIDSIEEEVARIESDDEGDPFTLPRWLLPSAARAGDVLRAHVTVDAAHATLRIERDVEATRAALDRSEAQLRERPVGQSKGDIAL